MKISILSTLLLLGTFDKVISRRVVDLGSLDLSEGEEVNEKREPKRLPLDIEGIVHDYDKNLKKREPKRVGLSFEKVGNDDAEVFDKSKVKRDMKRPQFVIDISDGKTEDRVNLDSRLTVLQDISIFSSYGRNVLDVESQWEDGSQELIVIAPTNAAISSLSKKPWQFPNDIDAMEEADAAPQDIEDAINGNIAHFVKSHIISRSNDFNLQSTEVWLHSEADSSEKGDIVLKKQDNEYYIASASDMDFKQVKTVDVAANGVILIIDACLIKP